MVGCEWKNALDHSTTHAIRPVVTQFPYSGPSTRIRRYSATGVFNARKNAKSSSPTPRRHVRHIESVACETHQSPIYPNGETDPHCYMCRVLSIRLNSHRVPSCAACRKNLYIDRSLSESLRGLKMPIAYSRVVCSNNESV